MFSALSDSLNFKNIGLEHLKKKLFELLGGELGLQLPSG